MSERSQLILYLAWATLVLVIFIAVLLVRRHGHTTETKKILDAIEGTRQQISVLDQSTQGDMRAIKQWLLKILVRFGFLRPGGE
jgi:hypothetical protein